MWELLPVVGGIVLGVVVFAARARGGRWGWVLAGAIVVGWLAAWASGELAKSPAFLLVDIPAACLGAVLAGYARDVLVETTDRRHGRRTLRSRRAPARALRL